MATVILGAQAPTERWVEGMAEAFVGLGYGSLSREGVAWMSAHRRLAALIAAACAFAAGVVFSASAAYASTAAPQIERVWAAGVGTTGASLNATIVPDPETAPEASDTVYRFEYGANASYGSRVPVADASISASTSGVEVSQPLGGLQPGTAYHYRVVAINPSGETVGEDRVFRTFALPASGDSCPNALIRGAQFSSSLPDCRAYELVSPPYDGKEGANVGTSPYSTQSATDGNAIKFYSRTAFGDAIGTTSFGGAEYVAERGTEGWSTHSITPEQGGVNLQPSSMAGYEGASPDLSKGIFQSITPVLAGYPNVANVNNLYLRTDLLNPGSGHYELVDLAANIVTPSMKEGDPQSHFFGNAEVWFVAASADWSHILFESNHDLTPEAEGLNPMYAKAYEWDEGTVRLVGILPNGEPAEVSVPGKGAASLSNASFIHEPRPFENNPPGVKGGVDINAMSEDGSRVIFTGPPVGYYGLAQEPGNNPLAGNLYMRLDHQRTVQLNANERSAGLGPDAWAEATFTGATPDDSKVFFSTTQALTDDAVVNSEEHKIYMYNLNAPEGQRLTLITASSEPNQRYDLDRVASRSAPVTVVGIGRDASYVYFVDERELLPGLVPLDQEIDSSTSRLYVWHDGSVHYVTSDQNSHAWFTGLMWGTSQLNAGDTFRTSADGETVAFLSADPLTAASAGYDNFDPTLACSGMPSNSSIHGRTMQRCYEVYVYNAEREEIQCASCNTSGAPARTDASFVDVADAANFPTQSVNHPLSSDGRYVFFDTHEALVPQDTNGRTDVYEFDTTTGRQYLLSSGTCQCNSYFVDASPDGSNAFFTTRQRLVSVDTDTSADLYDARIEGGIPAQNRPPAVACSGEECQGPVPSPPVFSVPASATFAGIGNPPAGAAKPVTAKKHAKRKPVRSRKHRRKKRKGKKSSSHASRRSVR